jgi:hypothetical protein
VHRGVNRPLAVTASSYAEDARGLVARMTDPIAPNFFALRRVSSNVERA